MNFKELISDADRFSEYLVDFKYILVDVNEYSEEELLEIANTILLIMMIDQKSVTKT